MRCPNCRNKMEPGVLQSGRDIVWSSKALRNKSPDVTVAEKKMFGSKEEAYYCTKCGFLVMKTR